MEEVLDTIKLEEWLRVLGVWCLGTVPEKREAMDAYLMLSRSREEQSMLSLYVYPDEVNQKVKWARKTHTRINKAALDNMHLCVLRYLLLRSAKQPPQLKGVLGSFKVALLPFSMEEYLDMLRVK